MSAKLGGHVEETDLIGYGGGAVVNDLGSVWRNGVLVGKAAWRQHVNARTVGAKHDEIAICFDEDVPVG